MGFDLSSIVDSAKQAVSSGVDNLEAQGVPAVETAAQSWAANVLTQQAAQLTQGANQSQSQLNAAVAKSQASASAPGSFASYFSNALKTAGLSTYSPQIIMIVVVVAVGGYFLLRKEA